MMNLKIVYPLSVSRVNQDGSPYEFTENRFFDQTKLFADYQKVDLGYVAKDDENYYLIPNEAGVEINPEMHGFGNPDINEAYKRTENVSDYTKAYAAFGKDRTLDYSAQIDKDLLDTNTENILGVSLVKVDENYQPTQIMPSAIGLGEQRVPTNNALLKETLDLIRSHIANKSNAHAIESISELSSSLNQLAESISSVNTIANNSLEIAEGAATAAGEAAQSINEHASSTTNPHPANTTQSFAEVVITPLKSVTNGGSVADADYNWFKGVYASLVDGSVLSWIKGLVNQVKSLATRVGLLEDQYILKYVVPVDTTAINLTTDRYGNALNLTDITIIADIQYTGPSGMSLRINNINGELYRNYNLDPAVTANYRNRFYIESSTNFILQKSVIELFILSNEVVLTSQTRGETAVPTYGASTRGVSNTVGMNINAITTINIFSYNVANSIKAGSVILIKKR